MATPPHECARCGALVATNDALRSRIKHLEEASASHHRTASATVSQERRRKAAERCEHVSGSEPGDQARVALGTKPWPPTGSNVYEILATGPDELVLQRLRYLAARQPGFGGVHVGQSGSKKRKTEVYTQKDAEEAVAVHKLNETKDASARAAKRRAPQQRAQRERALRDLGVRARQGRHEPAAPGRGLQETARASRFAMAVRPVSIRVFRRYLKKNISISFSVAFLFKKRFEFNGGPPRR